MGYAQRTPYAAAKWAVIGMTKSLAIELGPLGIRVNALCPGMVTGDRAERVIRAEMEAYGRPEDEVRKLYSEGVSLRTWIDPEEIAAMAGLSGFPDGPQDLRTGPGDRRPHRDPVALASRLPAGHSVGAGGVGREQALAVDLEASDRRLALG